MKIGLLIRKFLSITVPFCIILLLFLEFVLFRFILPASEWPYRRVITKEDPVVRYLYKDAPMYSHGTWRLGFPERYAARYTINHEGWNSTREYDTKKSTKTRIAVIGDSFVDALQVDVDQCFAELLEKKLVARGMPVEVYRFGFGNAGLSQYLNVLRYAGKKFQPDQVIVSIQANDFLSSILLSSNDDGDFLQFAHQGNSWQELPPKAYQPNNFRLFMKQSAIFRYLYGNLEFRYRTFRLGTLFRQSRERQYQMNVEINTDMYQIPLFEDLSLHILKEMKKALPSGCNLLLFMDADRDALYHGLDLKREKSYQLVLMLKRACERANVPFLELSDAFANDYKQFHQRFDYDIDRHWNRRGHEIVAETLAEYFNQHGV
jgi:GDSL-like lipase/acylhydrolase family protein